MIYTVKEIVYLQCRAICAQILQSFEVWSNNIFYRATVIAANFINSFCQPINWPIIVIIRIYYNSHFHSAACILKFE